MFGTQDDDSEREEQLNEILLTYVEAIQNGQKPNRHELIACYPEFAAELEEFFAGRDELESMAAPLREVVEARGAGFRRKRFRARLNGSGSAGVPGPGDAKPASGAGREEERSARAAPAGEPATELGQLGDFQLLRVIGRGGMGVVYEAEQISLRRHVALKVLPFASAVDTKQLQRFKIEAQAAALLHHTNIVPVHAIGYERGVHYYAMQYIEGQSLAAVIQELRQAAQQGQALSARRLTATGQIAAFSLRTTRAEERGAEPTAPAEGVNTERSTKSRRYFRIVAELGKRAAEALEHAHQQGVVHRDIKPGNLLLDRHANLWITDFGLAQLKGSGNLTMTGEILGTLLYMSPEQAGGGRGVVDHRTDLYSLGVTLYELLTLQPVFASRQSHELLRRILSEEPVPPRSIDRTIPPELETIVLKSIAKNPADRYASAREMAEDLERFLQDRPILARRPTLLDQVMKWGRRHRQIVLMTVLMLVGALALTTALVWREHAETKAAYERERENFRQARAAVELLVKISEEELRFKPQCEGVRKRVLETALAYYEDFLKRCQDSPAIRNELTAASKQVGEILAELSAMQGPGQFQLLTRKEVQNDLGLSDAQVRHIDRLAEEFSERQQVLLKQLHNVRLTEQRKKLDEVALKKGEVIGEILTPAQGRRLRQIELQDRFPVILEEPEVIKALQLTREQDDRIREIRGAVVTTLVEYMRQNLDDRKLLTKLQEMWEDRSEEILAMLTAGQKARWSDMTGKPFNAGLQSRRRMILRLLNLADR